MNLIVIVIISTCWNVKQQETTQCVWHFLGHAQACSTVLILRVVFVKQRLDLHQNVMAFGVTWTKCVLQQERSVTTTLIVKQLRMKHTVSVRTRIVLAASLKFRAQYFVIIAVESNVGFLCPDGEYQNTRRSSHVFVSGNNTDQTACLIFPENNSCRTLGYALTNIVNGIMWINTVYLEDEMFTQAEELYLKEEIRNSQRSIIITCLMNCVLANDIKFLFVKFHRNLDIKFENLTFIGAHVEVYNVRLAFVNVTFTDTLITDGSLPVDHRGEIALYFFMTIFQNDPSIKKFIIDLNDTFVITVSIDRSVMTNSGVKIVGPYIWYESRESSHKNAFVWVSAGVFCYAYLEEVTFTSFAMRETTLLHIQGDKVCADIFHSVLKHNVAGLNLTQDSSGLLESWIEVRIENCSFYNNSRLGSGGVILIQTFGHDARKEDTTRSYIQIEGSNFKVNKGRRVGLAGVCGGAVTIQDHFSLDDSFCAEINVEVNNNVFTNNQAEDGGGSVCLLGKCIEAKVLSCVFITTSSLYDSSSANFVLSFSAISIANSSFNRKVQYKSSSLVELHKISDAAEIKLLEMTIQCPYWTHTYSPESVSTEFTTSGPRRIRSLSQVRIQCAFCSSLFYFPSAGTFTVLHNYTRKNITVKDSSIRAGMSQCKPCPLGAHCPGDEVLSKPNFWGHATAGGVSINSCPPEYCCQQTPCRGLKQCVGYRSGTLCGACMRGYSLSLLSNQCIENADCDAGWMWVIALVAMLAYMLWYTFKDDIFGLPGYFRKKVCARRESHSSDDISHMDKGYFGIVTYFVQIKGLMKLSIEHDQTGQIETIFNKIEAYINLALNFELTYFSANFCPLEDLTTTDKTMFKLLFLFGIFCCSIILLLLVCIVECGLNRCCFLQQLRTRLITGLIEIVKYTYSGFTAIVFYSLTCTNVSESMTMLGTSVAKTVWFYDGSVQCYSKWQMAMVLLGLLHGVPYPATIYIGMKLLEQRRISWKSCIVATCFPLPVLMYWIVLTLISPKKKNDLVKAKDATDDENKEQVVYDGFAGGYREIEQGTQYWECVMMFRRLLLSSTILIPNSMIQLCVCLFLCTTYLLHHIHVKPFIYNLSNNTETFSLTMLMGVAAINMLKACYNYVGAEDNGVMHKTMESLELIEIAFTFLLIAFIFLFELFLYLQKRKAKVVSSEVLSLTPTHTKHSRVDIPKSNQETQGV